MRLHAALSDTYSALAVATLVRANGIAVTLVSGTIDNDAPPFAVFDVYFLRAICSGVAGVTDGVAGAVHVGNVR